MNTYRHSVEPHTSSSLQIMCTVVKKQLKREQSYNYNKDATMTVKQAHIVAACKCVGVFGTAICPTQMVWNQLEKKS